MSGQRALLFLWPCLLLGLTLCPCCQSRRPGMSRAMGGGFGRGPAPRAPPIQSQGSSNLGLKVAGAAAAGVLGGAVIGHGLSSMAGPGHGYGYGYGGYGHSYDGYGRYGGYGGGYLPQGRRDNPADRLEFFNETDTEYYTGGSSSSPIANCVVALGSALSFLLGNWVREV